MKAVRERTNGSVKLGPGSLYWAIQRLVEAGLLVESALKASHTDSRRRSYGLTKLGRGVLKHELAILADIVSFATESDLIDRPKPIS